MNKKTLRAVALVLALLCLLGGTAALTIVKGVFKTGNAKIYAVKNSTADPDSILRGKTVVFLGSSVTRGYASMGESFADYLAAEDGLVSVKEAVDGTTLCDTGKNSYVRRLQKLDPSLPVDAFVCQLSTNDASKGLPLGEVSEGFDRKDFDVSTVAGALEFIVSYVWETWGCPVVFFTSARFESEPYAKMVDLLYKVREKWGVGVIDLWNSERMNAVSEEDRAFYMADPIHPTRAGYKKWWTPEFRAYLRVFFELRERAGN